jgi:hypothetical protein
MHLFLFNIAIFALSPPNVCWLFKHVDMQCSDQKHEMPTSLSATCVVFACEHKTCIHNEEEKKEKNGRKE